MTNCQYSNKIFIFKFKTLTFLGAEEQSWGSDREQRVDAAEKETSDTSGLGISEQCPKTNWFCVPHSGLFVDSPGVV